jgi:hypothetical protein
MTTAPPLLGGTLGGGDFGLAEWVDDGATSAIAPLHVHAALIAALHEPGAHDELDGLFHRFDARLVH